MDLRLQPPPSWPGIAGQLSTCARPPEGNTGGQWFVDEDDAHWFVKADRIHAGLQSSAEVISARILAALGYPVPETHKLIIHGVELSAARDVGQASSTTHFETLDTPAVRTLRVAATYLADWDRVAPRSTNNLVHADGSISLIDFGGTLGARALGEHKPGPVAHPSVGAFLAVDDPIALWTSFRGPAIHDHPWSRIDADDLLDAAARLATLDDAGLGEIVDHARLPEDDAAAAMRHALITRRDALLRGIRSGAYLALLEDASPSS